jgi:cytochrome c2
MNRRMQMMGVEAPSQKELKALISYLQRHAQKPIDPEKYADLSTRAGAAFRATCGQCHTLPDPRQHTAQEWPGVVARMGRHLAAVKEPPDETVFSQIIGFLQRHSREEK